MMLAKPLELPCGAVLPNRVTKAAMSEQLATVAGRPTRAHVRLYETWARSGCGLVITGNVIVDRGAVSEPRRVAVEDARDIESQRGGRDGEIPGRKHVRRSGASRRGPLVIRVGGECLCL